MRKYNTARTILETSLSAISGECSNYSLSELKTLLKEINNKVLTSNDFYLDFRDKAVRVIDEDDISEILSDFSKKYYTGTHYIFKTN